ncbi:regulator of chromosome condensation 1/beta-lactamase-inhibitor protein II [Blastocladiella britannica]|nr:regulator of chromosome condensation 1/beta-lactamase-inhibitor protein II [Blastocladiella britannica]
MVKPGDLPLPTRPTAAGTTLIMGNGDCGQLGLGEDIKSRYKYAFVKAIKDQRVVHVACGGMHSLALCENGKVFSWGCNDDGALGREVPDGEECDVAEIPLLATLNVVKLACGDSISLALTGDGLIYGWGTFKGTETSQIGFSDGVNKATSPVLMTGTVFSSNRFVDVAAGNNHALALTSQGKVFSWGNTEHGQCGFKTHRPVSALNPRGLNFSHHKAIAVACGGDHSLVVDVEGDVWTFGLNNNGQCGSHPSNLVLHTPVVLLKPDPKVRAVAAAGGDHFSAVLLEDGHVLTFGKAADGQLGLGDLINLDADQNLTAERFYVDITAPDGEELRQEIPAHVYRAAVVPALHDIKAIAVGSNHAFAIDAHGVAWRWGFNEMGQCGTGDSANDEEATEDVTTPIPIDMSRSKSTVVAVAAGAQHSVIVANIPNTTPDAPVPEIQVNGGVDANGVDGDASSSSDPVAAPPLPAASQEPMDTTA